MRAERLINILTSLQAHGRATAAELAEENQVSLRTIYRWPGFLFTPNAVRRVVTDW